MAAKLRRLTHKMLYHLQFSLQATSPETFGYTLVYHRPLPNVDATANGSVMRCK
jgi:hypothetical protein